MSSLPRDLASEILANLPVKDLLRLKCVSTSFRSLIDTPYFTKLHKSRSNLYLLDKSSKQIRFLELDSLKNASEIIQPPLTSPAPGPVQIAGSCNGIVALFTPKGKVSLWNPATRKLRELPSPEITAPNPRIPYERLAYAFGYDSNSEDYKLVRVAQTKTPTRSSNFSISFTSRGEVFSLNTNTWRQIECPFLIGTDFFIHTRSEAFVNNAMHWISYFQRPDLKVVAFDLAKEEFYLVPIPDSRDHDLPCVGVLGGCLSMTFNNMWCPLGVHVWVMKEYGVKESWSKLFFLPLTAIYTKKNPSAIVTPIAYSKDSRKILLKCSCRLSWYDPTRETLESVDVLDGGDYIFETTLCMGSLMALDW